MLFRESGQDLPNDMLEEIFLKLPVKSLFRSKCVNKSWFDFIKNSIEVSYPALCFNNYASESGTFFFYVFIYDNEDTSAEFLENGTDRWHRVFHQPWLYKSSYWSHLPRPLFTFQFDKKLSFVAHCNGILCLANDYRGIVLTNPVLKNVKTLPNPKFYDEISIGSRQCGLIGFGFDNTIMDFKVVVVSHPIEMTGYDRQQQRVEVYSLRSHAWRNLDVFPFGRACHASGSTFLNGVVYWCAKIKHFGWRILTFNMATEMFQHFEFPRGWNHGSIGKLPALLVLNKESLAFVPYYPDHDESCSNPCVIWKVNNNENVVTSTKLYSLTLPSNIRCPVSFLKKRKFVYETTPYHCPHTGKISRQLILYDLLNHSHSVAYISLRGYTHSVTPSLKFGVFCPSYVSVNI